MVWRGGVTFGARQADGLGSRGQSVETSISGSCWCERPEAQRTSRQGLPTIVAGAQRRQALRRLHETHPVWNHRAVGLAIAGVVRSRRVGGCSRTRTVGARQADGLVGSERRDQHLGLLLVRTGRSRTHLPATNPYNRFRGTSKHLVKSRTRHAGLKQELPNAAGHNKRRRQRGHTDRSLPV